MPVFFQHQINGEARLGIWKIEESEEYFKDNVPLHREVTHPLKRLQHLAGRFLLRYLYPDFPYELIEIADTRKPFLPNEAYHFSISHCGDYAAAIVSPARRVGIDIEAPVAKILRISEKFLTSEESSLDSVHPLLLRTTLLWSAKESIFKWYGKGSVDFRRDINIDCLREASIDLNFHSQSFRVPFRIFEGLVLSYVIK
jgi:phosphopantetheinyl transferase